MSWDPSKPDQATNKLAGEIQLKKYGRLLEDYSHSFQSLSESLGECIEHSWDLSLDPISICTQPYENCNLFDVLDSDNKGFSKNLAAISSTCLATREIHAEAISLCHCFLFYGEGPMKDPSEGAASASRMLEPLQKLVGLLGRCDQVLKTALGQLAVLTAPTENKGSILFGSQNPDFNFHPFVDCIGEVLLALITIQEVLSGCSLLRTHWSLFKRTLKASVQEAGGHQEKLFRLQAVLSDLEKKLISGDVFKSCLKKLAGTKVGAEHPGVADQLIKYARAEATELEVESGQHLNWVKSCAILVLAVNLYGVSDKKVFKVVWDHYKKITAVSLLGTVLWLPESFFYSYLPNSQQLVDKKMKSAIASGRELHLQQKSQSLPREAQIYHFIVYDWLIQMDATLKKDSTQLKLDDLHLKCAVLLQGHEFLLSMGHIVKTIFNLHAHLGVPILRSSVVHLCKMIELMKTIQFMYFSKSIAVTESLHHLIQHITYQCLVTLGNVKKNVPADNKKNTNARLDVLAALHTMERCLQGSCNRERRVLAKLALVTASQLKIFQNEELSNLKGLLSKLDRVCELQRELQTASDCSFLYWHRVVLPIYFSRFLEERTDLRRLKYMFAVFRDCSNAMAMVEHLEDPKVLQQQFKSEMQTALKLKLLDPLCQEIETDLRLRVHSHLQVKDESPKKQIPIAYNSCQTMYQLSPLRFFDDFISIRAYIENYLSETFYNLTTVALHDWKTYGEMRILAREKYGLTTVEDHLPSQTLEQGLDVLEIMRNIHTFVSGHVYNLNNQMFIELSSNNKYLNTINVQHIANSIRTHGTGIINTTVNFTYQFLKKKFQMLSQFLFDARIKSRLIKDMRHFQETKENSDQKYSFVRAEKFNVGIRKLGVSADGLSYLDEFRSLITHIGNAMGYVRMMRSGSRHYMSKAICFIPDLEDVVSFENLATEEGMTHLCIQSAKELDEVVNGLVRNFEKGIEYFQLLVDVFAPISKDVKNSHLKMFHAIIPPLTINFIEHIITSKDRLNKNVKEGATFTDDGFAMGLAYLLKVLELDSMFDSLHWFQSVKEKYETEKEELKKQSANIKKGEEKLKQTLILTEKRLDSYQQEFELLFFNISSARIFFKRYTNPDEPKNEAKSENNDTEKPD